MLARDLSLIASRNVSIIRKSSFCLAPACISPMEGMTSNGRHWACAPTSAHESLTSVERQGNITIISSVSYRLFLVVSRNKQNVLAYHCFIF